MLFSTNEAGKRWSLRTNSIYINMKKARKVFCKGLNGNSRYAACSTREHLYTDWCCVVTLWTSIHKVDSDVKDWCTNTQIMTVDGREVMFRKMNGTRGLDAASHHIYLESTCSSSLLCMSLYILVMLHRASTLNKTPLITSFHIDLYRVGYTVCPSRTCGNQSENQATGG